MATATDPLGTKQVKYIVVTGGTVSGLGKGTAISSLGVLLRMCGLRVTSLKIDPYLNVDAGTMSPYEHGEVYVLEDGSEVDLDCGNYERFLDITLGQMHNMTSGKIFDQVIKRERTGEYLGKTVQLIPHCSDAVQDWITTVAMQPVDRQPGAPDVCLIELGGTVGDIESGVYLEALQQLQWKVGKENFVMIHVGMVPVMGVVGEQKTKPTQQSVRKLREAGILPDFLFCRSETPLEDGTRKKLSLFCQVPEEHVISLHDVSNIFRVPLLLAQQKMGTSMCARLGLPYNEPENVIRDLGVPMSTQSIADWKAMADRVDVITEEVVIGMVGKYNGLQDSYLSVLKSLKHATIEAGLHLIIEWIDSSDLEPNMRANDPAKYDTAWRRLKQVQGVLCPGGFGDRGVEGKALSSKYCRESNIPYFGICLGLQTAVIDFARHELGWDDANSTEFNENTKYPVVIFMP